MSRRRSQYVNDFDDQSNIHVLAQKGTQVVFIIQTFSNILGSPVAKGALEE